VLVPVVVPVVYVSLPVRVRLVADVVMLTVLMVVVVLLMVVVRV
jgi:hypothetical protein